MRARFEWYSYINIAEIYLLLDIVDFLKISVIGFIILESE